jgi:acetyl/propionyl-CoA carboxylase alpha subunit
MVYGVDLVHAQLDLAEGRWPEALGSPRTFTVPEPHGVALEARILAEDPRGDFLPATGTLLIYREPTGPGVRVDSGVREGDPVTPHFDSMIAKLIVRGATRAEAVARLSKALESFIILGCTTNRPFLLAVSRHPDYLAGRESTAWIPENLAILNESLVPSAWQEFLASRSFVEALAGTLAGSGKIPEGPFARFAAQVHPELRAGGTLKKPPFRLTKEGDHPNHFTLRMQNDGATLDLWACRRKTGLELSAFGETWVIEDPSQAAAHGALDGLVRAPMAGKVIEVRIGVGDRVGKGQILFLVESMKMQMEVTAPRAGRVASIAVEAGQILPGPETMAVLEGE